jgi:hypothetical protein
MGEKHIDNVVSLETHRNKQTGKVIATEAMKLIRISDEIDQILLKHLDAGDVDAKDLAGLLSHRLGSLMRHMDGKEKLLPVCLRVLKRQAAVE